jgi:abortive infection bacteriophage resistance protein
MTKPFTTPPTNYQQQRASLEQRGMIINNPRAEHYLRHLNYHRLAAYWLPFEDHNTHRFQPGTDFDVVLNHYVFDRALRLLVFDAIERFEVSVRSQWAYHMAHNHGVHAHLDRDLFVDRGLWKSSCHKLERTMARSEEASIKHFRNTYREPLPPVWLVCELMSLGQLSHWYSNLKPAHTRQAIANAYDISYQVLASWLHHFTYVRNLCAHHNRLWNRDFTITPKFPKKRPSGLRAQCHDPSRRLYNTLLFLLYCLDVISPDHHWRNRLARLVSKHHINVTNMGFPHGWEDFPMWQG